MNHLQTIETAANPAPIAESNFTEIDKQVWAAPVPIPAADINWSLGPLQTKTLAANIVFTFSNTPASPCMVVAVTNAGAYTVTWPGGVLWQGGVAPTQTTGAHTDIYRFTRIGTTIYGSVAQNY